MLLTALIFLIAIAATSDEFWDYEEQVNLEAFSSSTFYDILLKHSVSVTTRLGQLKEEVNFLWFVPKLIFPMLIINTCRIMRLHYPTTVNSQFIPREHALIQGNIVLCVSIGEAALSRGDGKGARAPA